MTFTIDNTEAAGAVVALRGDVLGGADAMAFSDALSALAQTGGVRMVVVDLGGVGLMNSSGLGMLVGAMKSMRSLGGRMALCGANQQIRSLLKMTRLDSVLAHYDTPGEALTNMK